jgi:predicted dehydrogenase
MTVRFGLAGTGHWAQSVHIPGLLRTPDATLAAVWGHTATTIRSIADRYRIDAFERFEDMLNVVDAVSFALPPDVQAELAPVAAEAGKHLLLEKPVARTSAAAATTASLARANSLSTLVFFMRRFVPEIEQSIRIASDRRWERARVVAHYATLSAPTPYTNSKWRREPGGALWDLAPHALSILIPVLGPVREVVADVTAPAGTFRFTAQHERGAMSEVSLSLEAQPGEEALEYRFESPGATTILPNPALDRPSIFATAVREFTDEIARSSTMHRCNVRFGAQVTRTIECIQASAAQRRSIAVPSIDD